MIGAPALVALAALRSGAGLAKVLAPGPVINEVLAMTPSATGMALDVDAHGRIESSPAAAVIDLAMQRCGAVAIGPGLGREPEAGPGVASMVLRVLQQDLVPVVVDADAIGALAGIPSLHHDFAAPAVLTPHPGEFRTIGAALRIGQDPTDAAARPRAAEALAQRLGCVVVLKGAGTVVTDGHRTWVCNAGHACLGTAGTGDVLTGLLAGLIAQFVRIDPLAHLKPGAKAGRLDLFDAARAAVLAHGLAGEAWAKSHGAEAGLLASELADLLPGVLSGMTV